MSTCVPAAIKDPGDPIKGITQISLYSNYLCMYVYVYVCVRQWAEIRWIENTFKFLNPSFELR